MNRLPALVVLASVVTALALPASGLGAASADSDSPAIVSRGAGPTVVILSGLLGGTARLQPLAEQLVASGFRVVAVDPYRLSAAATDVSFDGLARTVATALHSAGVGSAIIVAHAHASGIALRLAANFPSLASNILLLDAGVIASTRSAGVTRAIRLASLVARFPGGHGVIRSRLTSGLRENSGNPGWVTDAIARAYADPMIAELPAVSRMAERLASAAEPESVEQVLAKVRAEVTVLIGAAPHGFSAREEELALLRRMPNSRVRRLDGVGHFVHEEAAHAIVAEVLAAQARRALALR